EFFYIVNELDQNHKQVVISSDRPIKEIVQLEDPLRFRFEWGVIVDIRRRYAETRMGILRQKIGEAKLDIPPEALNYISSQIQSNIRELEGALTRLLAY
ncbi:chromosomal replication initiation protein, partial [Staphylococcus aureus]